MAKECNLLYYKTNILNGSKACAAKLISSKDIVVIDRNQKYTNCSLNINFVPQI
jgi:hypothetical protein